MNKIIMLIISLLMMVGSVFADEPSNIYRKVLHFHQMYYHLGVYHGYKCNYQMEDFEYCNELGEKILITSLDHYKKLLPNDVGFSSRDKAISSYKNGIWFVYNHCLNNDMSMDDCSLFVYLFVNRIIQEENY